MPKQEKGKSHSIRPVSRRPPSWCKYQPEEVESFIIKLAKEGHSLSSIGTILRDQYAIPLAKPIVGKSISDVLEGAGLAPSLPEDLSNLMKKAQSLASTWIKTRRTCITSAACKSSKHISTSFQDTISVKVFCQRTGSTKLKSPP